jgi:hypothetical protein
LTAAVAGLVYAHALAAPPAGAPDPWANVPALPTACYSSQDQWWEQNDAALYSVQQAHYKQDETNGAIRQQATDALNADPMAMAQRLQQAMMDDPQNAQKYMEQQVQQAEQLQAESPAAQEKEKQIEGESEAIMKQYEAALAKAMEPAEERWTALKKKMGIPMDSHGPGEIGVPDWAWTEWYAILKDRDRAYASNCAQWWTATGPIHTYMNRYKTYLVEERIPYEKRGFDEPKLQQYQRLNVSTAGWRTTTEYEAAEDYMKMASKLFNQRAVRPFCQTADRCG